MIARLMGLRVITPVELLSRVQAGTVRVFDVVSAARSPGQRVPGAAHLPSQELEPGDLPPDHDAPLVFYCSGPLCRRAPQAARRAIALGYRDVRVLSAGISGWMAEALPTEPAEPNPGMPPHA